MATLTSRIVAGSVTSTDRTLQDAAAEVRRRRIPALAIWVLGQWAFLAYVEDDGDITDELLDEIDELLVGLDRRSIDLGASRALATRALVDSDGTSGPQAQRAIAARLEPLVERYQRMGWRADVIAVLLALHVTSFRAGDLAAAAGHAAYADLELEQCHEARLLHRARERLDMGIGGWRAPARPRPLVELSEQQHTVLDHLEAGHTYAEIADAIGATRSAVGSIVGSIYNALGVSSSHEAVLARRRGAPATDGSGRRLHGHGS